MIFDKAAGCQLTESKAFSSGIDKELLSFNSDLLQVGQGHSLALPSLTKKGRNLQDCFMHWLEDAAEYESFNHPEKKDTPQTCMQGLF